MQLPITAALEGRWHTNLRLPEAAGMPQRRWRAFVSQEGYISRLLPLATGAAAAGIDWDGAWLSPAGIDLQINGGLGLAFPELQKEQLPRLFELLDLLWRDGVEAICPTFVTCAVAPLRRGLAVLEEARLQHRPGRCRLLGAHLEGPFLAPERRGAHPLEHLCAPSIEALRERIAGFESSIALVTLAPELSGAELLINALRQQGILVSLGHSAATGEQAQRSYGQGVGMITHALNAMAGLHHRSPGPIAAAIVAPQVGVGLIADGIHVAPAMAVLLQRLLPEQVLLVSDALAPYGLSPGAYPWDERQITVKAGTCRLGDGTLAGTTLALLEGVKRLAAWSGNPNAAIRAATVLPRRQLGDLRPVEQQLMGMALVDTLKWQLDADYKLGWQRNG
ncbi:MAG: N-acetylglucosamine-6-phosphate deacetylase [Cyanobacteria bacterium]|nr:N-acetylglucosamine-6-phosphate deacetylase [Cyanobacteriota bacterium]